MLGFVKARKWVDFVDKNLSQQTKNWDRFIDPPYSRAQHNLTCCVHDVYIYIISTQHLYTSIVHSVCARGKQKSTHTQKHAVTNTLPLAPSLTGSLTLRYVCILRVPVCMHTHKRAVLLQTESVEKREKEVCTNTHEKLRTEFTELCYVTYILYIYKCMWCQFFFHRTSQASSYFRSLFVNA